MNHNDFKEGDRVKIIISWSRVQEINKKVKEANPPEWTLTRVKKYLSLSGLIGVITTGRRINSLGHTFLEVKLDNGEQWYVKEVDLYHANSKKASQEEEEIPENEMTAYVYSLFLKEAEMI